MRFFFRGSLPRKWALSQAHAVSEMGCITRISCSGCTWKATSWNLPILVLEDREGRSGGVRTIGEILRKKKLEHLRSDHCRLSQISGSGHRTFRMNRIVSACCVAELNTSNTVTTAKNFGLCLKINGE